MKIKIYYLLLLSILAFACSNDDQSTDEEQNGEANLEIIDYNPKETFTAEEVIIQTQGVNATATIQVLFSGVISENVIVEGSNIIARVPSGASSGDISISYNEEVVNVGAVEINQETDKLYAGISDNGIAPSFYELNTDNGTIGELYFNAAGYDFVSGVLYSKESNTVYNSYCNQCGMVGCICSYVLQNLDSGMDWTRTVCTDFVYCPLEYYRAKSLANDRLFYVYYGNGFHFLSSLNIATMESTLLRDFVVDGEINISSGSLFLEDTNELVGFDNATQNFIRVNLNDFATSEFSYPDVVLSSLQQSQSGKIYATYNDNSIVELNPANGEVVDEIFTHIAKINSLSYSESTGRFFWYGNNGDASRLYIFNPSNQITTVIQFQEKFTQLLSDY